MKILKFLRRYPEIIILTIAALATRMWALFSPASVVFDEVYFKAFAGNYLTGAYFFDIHPPVGKLLLAGWHKDGEHPWKFPSPLSRGLFFGLIGLALIGFIYFAPLTYGVPLSPADMDRRIWLPTWR